MAPLVIGWNHRAITRFMDDPDAHAQPQAPPPHLPVLPREVLELLDPKPGMVCLDCTVGTAGHAAIIAPRLAPGGRYIGLDVDPNNIALAQERLDHAPVTVNLVRSNFVAARDVLGRLGIEAVDLLIADLGFSSNQMDDPARGLSFNCDGPLDMRLDPSLPQTAADLVNTLPQQELADLIYQHGQERHSRKIARKIVEYRHQSPINTSACLARLVRGVYGRVGHKSKPRGRKRIDAATRTFMALRIAVNAELSALERLLDDLPALLRPGAVAVMISFHSLEDRLVKHAFVGMYRSHGAQRLTPKPVVADPQERHDNPRSRSAKLRAIRWPDATEQKIVDFVEST